MSNINQQNLENLPLVSVIIPSYNHGKYLPEAVKSIREQDYPRIEIIIVDDGSTDNTSDVVKTLPPVKYIYQQNRGLSAARNTGIKNSAGEMLVFLDADDWLLPGAIKVNIAKLQADEKLAFASGAHLKIYESSGRQVEEYQGVRQNAYLQLLQGNYIGMHATVMYRKWVFDTFIFDENLRACEDYDLYLNITRKHQVVHHSHKIAA
ncbi:glycosyltransferase [soil metagenome]